MTTAKCLDFEKRFEGIDRGRSARKKARKGNATRELRYGEGTAQLIGFESLSRIPAALSLDHFQDVVR